VTIIVGGEEVFKGVPVMTLSALLESAGRGDSEYMFPARVNLN